MHKKVVVQYRLRGHSRLTRHGTGKVGIVRALLWLYYAYLQPLQKSNNDKAKIDHGHLNTKAYKIML